MRKRKIQERLRNVEQHLRNAEAFVARNENVESTSFLHLKDWEGKSGHPLWMKNYAIPAMQRSRARDEKKLDRIASRAKDKNCRNAAIAG